MWKTSTDKVIAKLLKHQSKIKLFSLKWIINGIEQHSVRLNLSQALGSIVFLDYVPSSIKFNYNENPT
jgi:hypothetical protein